MRKIIISAAAAALLLSSCGSFVDGYEISPNSALVDDATPSVLLPVVEGACFISYTGQLARVAAVITQHQAGTDGQFISVGEYKIRAGDNVNDWEGLYSNGVMNSQQLIDVAGDANPYYRGIGRVMKAMFLGLATDLWGNIPNREALQAADNFEPGYDDQELVISDIQQLLEDAITDFGRPEGDNIELPGSADYIFSGDVSKWIISAHILRARYANRLSKKDPSGSATAALGHIDAAITAGMMDPSSDMMAKFGENSNELNQWFAFLEARPNYIKMGAFFVDTLKGIDDPRLSFYAAENGNNEYVGTEIGTITTTTSEIGSYFASASKAMPLVTYAEAKFIEAEAALRAGQSQRAADAYNEAVIAHITKVTGAAPNATYTTAQASETASSINLDKIMFQKYLAMFTQPESWSDWRRTGIPALSPDPRSTQNEIPRRLPTPQSELDYNSNSPGITDIFRPVWWDA